LNPANDPLRNATFSGTVTAANFVPPSSLGTNTRFGFQALNSLTSGSQNSAFGYRSLTNVTSGSSNVGAGYQSGVNLTTGSDNVCLGTQALPSASTVSQVVAIGTNTLQLSSGANSPRTVAIGYQALQSNGSTGVAGDSTAVGWNSLNGETGTGSTAVGSEALKIAAGGGSVALGRAAGKYEVGGNAFYIDNQDRTNTAGDKAGAILYGTFNATPSLQTLRINAVLQGLLSLTNGANPVVIQFPKAGYTEVGTVGSLGQYEMNMSYNMNYNEPGNVSVHRLFDQTKTGLWEALGNLGWFMQYAPATVAAGDVWTAGGSLYNMVSWSPSGDYYARRGITSAPGLNAGMTFGQDNTRVPNSATLDSSGGIARVLGVGPGAATKGQVLVLVLDTTGAASTNSWYLQDGAPGTTINGNVSVPTIPTSAAGLAAGQLWVDTTGGLNILKRV
jgi:hypothetical protein